MKQKAVLKFGFGIWMVFMQVSLLRAQTPDTVQLTLPKAEAIFLQNNLSLLAAQYNINANQALIQQAKSWNNPTLSTEQNLYDGRFFNHSKTSSGSGQNNGEIYASLQQVLQTAGKRNKLVQIAQDNTRSAEAQFNEVMRNLRFVLATDYNNLAQLQSSQGLLEEEIAHLQKLSKGMDEMLKVGDISQKENLRIKAYLFSLQSDYAENLLEQQGLQKDLRTLLQGKESQVVRVSLPQVAEQQVAGIALAPLLDSAKALRPDISLAHSQLQLQQHNYNYQKALAVPDVTLGVDYDKSNSYVSNYYGLQLSLPLPVFNKNSGNIVAAGWNIKQAQAALDQNKSVVQNEILAAYQKVRTLLEVQKAVSGPWVADYNRLLQNMISSYEQRKVSLIDFIDFFSSYKDMRLKQLKQQTDLANAAAELNYVTNQTVISLN